VFISQLKIVLAPQRKKGSREEKGSEKKRFEMKTNGTFTRIIAAKSDQEYFEL
jgi:hypothetical protein